MKTDFKVKGKKERTTSKNEAEPCLYCGKATFSRNYIINPGAEHELPSCSEECFNKARDFVDYDRRYRMVFYFILLAMIVANLFLLGSKVESRWGYFPMMGIATAALIFPLVFTRYERYQKFGIRKTKIMIRFAACGIVILGLVLIIGYQLG
jgi:hypothetical protein